MSGEPKVSFIPLACGLIQICFSPSQYKLVEIFCSSSNVPGSIVISCEQATALCPKQE